MKCIIDSWEYKKHPVHTVVEEEGLEEYLLNLIVKAQEGISIFVWKQNLKKQWALFKMLESGRQPQHLRRLFGLGVDYQVNDVI